MGGQPAPQPNAAPTSSLEHLRYIWQHPEELLFRLVLIALVALLAVLVYVVIRRVLHRVHRRLAERTLGATEPLRRRLVRSLTIVSLLNSIVRWLIILLGGMWVLTIAGMNLWPLLTGAGIAGIAIGLGAQSLIRDFLSGIFLTLEGQFAVGDYVTINGLSGTVQEVGLRITVLRDLENQTHYLPNGSVATVTVYEEPKVAYVLEFEVPSAEQAEVASDALQALLHDAQTEFRPYLRRFSEPETLACAEGIHSIRAELEMFPHQEWLVREELPARLMRRLKARGLELPDEAKPRAYVAMGRA